MRRNLPWIVVGVLVAAALAGAWHYRSTISTPAAGLPHRLTPANAERLAVGERVYRAHCATCHGQHLEGQANWRQRGADGLLPAPPHDASGHTWHHPDETLFRITKYGVAAVIGDPGYATSMPVYEGALSDEEIVAVLSWIKSRWPPSVQRKHDEINTPSK